MRKIFTTLLSVTAAVGVAMAASPMSPQVNKLSIESRYAAPTVEKLSTAQRSKVLGAKVGGQYFIGEDVQSHKNMRVKTAAPKAQSETPVVIEEAPDGLQNLYSRSGDGFMAFYGMILPHEQNGQILNATITMDFSTIYIQDPVSSAITGTWVKGSFDYMNSKVSVPTGQYILYDEEAGFGAFLGVGKLTEVEEDGDVYVTYVYDESSTEITYNVAPDLSIKLEDKFFSTEELPEYVVTLFWSDDMSWAGYCDYNSAYTPVNEFITTLPYDVEASDWAMRSKDVENDSELVNFVKVGVKDDKMYLGGLNPEEPEAYAVGTIADGKVTFPNNQYLGVSNVVYLTYFVSGEYALDVITDPVYGDYIGLINTPKDNLVFDYDAEAQTLTSADNASFYVNAGKCDVAANEEISFFESYFNPSLFLFHEVAATPAAPEILSFHDSFDTYGYCGLFMNIPAVSTEGEILNVNKLYYEIYTRVDGEEEPFVFYVDEYVGLAELGLEEMTEVPYTMQLDGFDGEDIRYGGEAVFFYFSPVDAYGVKSIYKGGDEVHESPVVWFNVNTTGVKDTLSDGSATVAEIYSIDGVRRSSMARGLNIVKMSDGSVRKMIVR